MFVFLSRVSGNFDFSWLVFVNPSHFHSKDATEANIEPKPNCWKTNFVILVIHVGLLQRRFASKMIETACFAASLASKTRRRSTDGKKEIEELTRISSARRRSTPYISCAGPHSYFKTCHDMLAKHFGTCILVQSFASERRTASGVLFFEAYVLTW